MKPIQFLNVTCNRLATVELAAAAKPACLTDPKECVAPLNRPLTHIRYALLLAAAALFFTHPAAARPWRPGQIPNGNVFSCTTCHNSDFSRNAFGLAVQALVAPGSEDPFWDPALAALDSDGDGFTNGEELGDPDGDGTPTSGVRVTQPGNRNSKPNPLTITSTALTQLGFTLAWTNGTPPFLVQEKKSAEGAEWTDVLTTDAPVAVVPREGDSGFLRVQSNTGKTVMPFTVWMHGAAERPDPVSTQGTGFGTLMLEGQTLTVRVRFSGLSANASAAHIHGPAGTTDAAGVMIPITDVPNDTSGVIEGRIDVSELPAEQMAALKEGRTYFNLHTQTHPDGEIRGRVAPLLLQSSLTGAAERPDPVTTSGTGSGRFWLVGNEITYEVTYGTLSAAATAAHLHGPADASGSAGVLVPLQPTNGMLGTAGAFSGSASLTPEQFGHLLDGLTYANIHTSNNPGGEIRGQITP